MKMPSTEQRNSLAEATMLYMENLDLALPYLERRGITEEAARHAALGVVVDPVKGDEHLKGRLSIPYLTDSGPVAMSFRCIEDHGRTFAESSVQTPPSGVVDCKFLGHGKYMKGKGSASYLYGVQSYEGAGSHISLCEGELDTLVLQMLGEPAMGVPGAANWQEHWKDILMDFSHVYIFSDGDNDGRELAHRVKMECEWAIDIPMPEGMDVNSAYLAYGKEFLLSKVR